MVRFMQSPDAELSEPPVLTQEPAGPDRTERAIRVVVADDHPVVRRGLRQVFDAEGDIDVVAEAVRRRNGVGDTSTGTTPTCS